MMRMVRFLLMLVAGAFIMGALKIFFSAMQRGLGGGSSAEKPAGTPGATAETPIPPGGELKKCPACGTYNAISNSVVRQRGKETLYYCSSDCSARHAA